MPGSLCASVLPFPISAGSAVEASDLSDGADCERGWDACEEELVESSFR